MKINFAQANHEDIDVFGDDNLFGPDEYGNFYYNCVEYGTNPGGLEEVTIHDTCNRYMPIAIESIPELIKCLEYVYDTSCKLKQAEELQDDVFSDKQGTLNDYDELEFFDEPVQDSSLWTFR